MRRIDCQSRLHRGGLSDLELQRLLDKLPVAAYTCDASGKITYFNEHATVLWGRAPKLNDDADRFCGSWRLFAADGTPIGHQQCWMALALGDGNGYNGREILVERPDGTRRTALAHANPFIDDCGEIRGAVNVLVDITDRKRDEERLREADRQKSEFLAMLAHELRNPLAPIRNCLEITRMAGSDESAAADALVIMERQLAHLVRLIDDLMDIFRGSSEATSDGREKRSEFTVRMPAVVAHAHSSPRGDCEDESNHGCRKLRILVVDDNKDSAISLSMMLTILGHDTQTSFDGLDAVEKSRLFKPHVVLLDIGLPKLNGYAVCRRIRAQPDGRDAVMIAMTGWGQDEDKRQSMEAGFDFHRVKPLDPAALCKLLADLFATAL